MGVVVRFSCGDESTGLGGVVVGSADGTAEGAGAGALQRLAAA